MISFHVLRMFLMLCKYNYRENREGILRLHQQETHEALRLGNYHTVQHQKQQMLDYCHGGQQILHNIKIDNRKSDTSIVDQVDGVVLPVIV